MLVSLINDYTGEWFSNLFKCATFCINTSSRGPITLSTAPSGIFDRTVLENLGVRALLSTGIGDHQYSDRIFSARITLPKIKRDQYEALIFNFVVVENSERITLKMNSKALTLLVLIYPKAFRRYINRFEEDFELLLSQSTILPTTTADLLDEEQLTHFIKTLRKSMIAMENESLLNYEEFTATHLFDEENMAISYKHFIDELFNR